MIRRPCLSRAALLSANPLGVRICTKRCRCHFRGRSIPILDNRRFGANTPQFANYPGWVELNIQAPVAISQRINFTLRCQ